MSLENGCFMDEALWPVLLADRDGCVRRANAAAVAFFGQPLRNLPVPLAAFWPANSPVPWKTLLQTPATTPPGMPRVQFIGPDGSPSDKLVCCCPHPAQETAFLLQFLPAPTYGAPPSRVESTGAQKQKLECALQLARTVALDFNNVLTSILGHTSLILSKLEPGHPWRPSLLEVEKSANKAASIANDLGTFSNTDREVKTPAAGNVNNILRRCIDLLRDSEACAQVHWSLQLEKDLFASKFDEAKIQQAFAKILDNAIESLPGEGKITLSSRNLELAQPTQDRTVFLSPGAYVCVEFQDTGAGITADILPRVFEPFFTTKGAGHRGLGLAWVYGILTNHGGGVAVSSQPGTGTSVRVYLPAEKRQLHDSGVASPDSLAGNQTILLVDDEELLLSMGQTILSSYGYRVLVANNGVKALELLAQKDPLIDLLITDLVMPGMNGSELARETRRISPETRILSTSGYVWGTGKDTQPNYLQKPFTTQELLIKVKEILG